MVTGDQQCSESSSLVYLGMENNSSSTSSWEWKLLSAKKWSNKVISRMRSRNTHWPLVKPKQKLLVFNENILKNGENVLIVNLWLGYNLHHANSVWCLPKMEKLDYLSPVNFLLLLTKHSYLFLLDRHQTARARCLLLVDEWCRFL